MFCCPLAAHAGNETALHAFKRRKLWHTGFKASSLSAGGAHLGSTKPDTPLLDALRQHAGTRTVSFHIPGHKQRPDAVPDVLGSGGNSILSFDLTELPGLDNLADPSGPIADAQALAAEVFGADQTWFLVNGTSVGLQAAVMATCNPGDTILVARNCHISVFAAMTLTGCSPAWVSPNLDEEAEIATCITPQALLDAYQQAVSRGTPPKAAVVVSPTYFGTCSDIKGLAEACHGVGIPLVVDEAHGAHLGLHPGFPASAMQQGADVAVQSTHKTLTALGQASMLHFRGRLVQRQGLAQSLRMLQTTSPSYLLMASLDGAQAQARRMRAGTLALPLESIAAAVSRIDLMPNVSLVKSSEGLSDPWRITLDVSGLGVSGFLFEKHLQDDFGIFPELATHKVVVFALGPGSVQSDLDHLVSTLQQCCCESPREGKKAGDSRALAAYRSLQQAPAPCLDPREAFFASKEMVDFSDAEGRVSADLICPYPPGIPVVFPGERLTVEALQYIQAVANEEGEITGATDSSLKRLCVIADHTLQGA